ncbi:hypothetical protein L2K70_09995 [Nocardioides KLBMP 9356]|uniref:DUF3592 domain-containing protein n=1 Tax=Nocardioides potassii TaxID=2911371 RepID=A0ABS9HCB3_9ACTN|nr:hypothetical protein [Nocardioides potassii]MCF6377937.1 hypothetical protein [Nocardioides potassii]
MHDEWRGRRWRLTALTFIAMWLTTGVSFVLLGEKEAALHDLESAIAEGEVTQVEIVGYPTVGDWRGTALVTLRWRGDVLHRYALVKVDKRRNAGSRITAHGDPAVVLGDLEDYLTAISPGYARTDPPALELTYADHLEYQEWNGWRAPDVPAVLGLATWFGTVLLAGAGPQPWRATSWAWIWLILFGGPLGSLAFLLLGGPLGLWRPKDLGRRLTGGWAFLIGVVLLGRANGTNG